MKTETVFRFHNKVVINSSTLIALVSVLIFLFDLTLELILSNRLGPRHFFCLLFDLELVNLFPFDGMESYKLFFPHE